MADDWYDDTRRERRSTAMRLFVAALVLGGGYAGLCVWSSEHVPASVSVGGIQVGGMTPESARAAIAAGSRPLLSTPIGLSVPGRDEPVQVVPGDAGLAVDADRSLEGLTGLTLDPRTVWDRLTGSVRAPLLTSADDDALTAYVDRLAPSVAVAPVEGRVTFPGGSVAVDMPVPGHTLDVPATKLALRRAFPDSTQATAVVRETPPLVSGDAVEAMASDFGTTAMSEPLTLVSGSTRVRLDPSEYAPTVSVVADASGRLTPHFDETALARLVASKVTVTTRAATSARWEFEAGHGKPRLVPSVDGLTVDENALAARAVAAISGTDRTVDVGPAHAQPPFTTEDAQKAGINELVADFSSPFPTNDPTRTHNLVVAAQHIDGTYVPPGGTFSLNAILGERTEDKGYADGTVIIDGRLTRGTGGGISQVSTVVYNLAYFAGVDFIQFSPHAFFIPRYPEGREATVYWPTIDNKWKNDTPYGMLLQTWVEGGSVHGRVWSTKTWDVTSVKGGRRNVVPPKTIRDDSLKCYPQQPNPGFDVTVTRQW
ncbi:VanW family protein [Terrabacter aerolatus]|uniref:Vanomycin resistance protein VanB n=1 Tax=Terrabacter aerolatus TaxID=422442 RepID=A0A512D5I4_9MICO|nr:VanW family protein [Terrabacter aerolatus]GEO31726.1 vanomycin resistance protein VanB [Terrabacter aerolatus]